MSGPTFTTADKLAALEKERHCRGSQGSAIMCGVPDNVQNRDSRPGVAAEAGVTRRLREKVVRRAIRAKNIGTARKYTPEAIVDVADCNPHSRADRTLRRVPRSLDTDRP
jgi:hypothetical protein